MPDLIRLQTPDFEFLVWVSDIGARNRVYQETIKKRSSLEIALDPSEFESALELRFEPKVELLDFALVGASGELQKNEPERNSHRQEKITRLALDSPLFFENTQYQFEWTFFSNITKAELVHKSRTVNEAFRFVGKRNTSPARLTGIINTRNDVGWMRLPLNFELDGKIYRQNISFEVLPTKMVLHRDLPTMYRCIDAVYPLWRFSLVEKTEQDAATSKHRGYFPLMWLANFNSLRERFNKGLKVICAAPHSRLQPLTRNIKAAKLKGHLSHRLGEKIRQDFANSQYDKRYRVEKNKLSVDTPENRFIKMAVTQCKRQIGDFESKLRISNQAPEWQRLSDSFLTELHSWQQPLKKVLNQSFLKEVGVLGELKRESLVLQQKTGYSAVYRVWQELKFYLDIFDSQSSISMKSVAEIYEVWCFLCLKQILEQDLGFTLDENGAAKLWQNNFFEYQLKDGFAGAFRFEREDGVTARLAHEPKFTKKGKTIRSYLVNQEPDIVLEVTLPKAGKLEAEKQFIWIFDAKYRIKTDKNRFDTNDEDIERTDYVPDDAINQMHRYRDALIRLSSEELKRGSKESKSRPVFGAFALYPGFFDQNSESNPYAEAIDEISIGAFALLPSSDKGENVGGQKTCGHVWLLEFLKSQIGTAQKINQTYPSKGIAEQLYVQEAARIPYHGMQQVLYPDLVMTAGLAPSSDRNPEYYKQFENETSCFYHMPVSTFELKFNPHICQEIKYLSFIEDHLSKYDISCVWPVRRVQVMPRSEINIEKSGKASTSTKLYFLFELGKPLSLAHTVSYEPGGRFRNSMKLTTLSQLDQVSLLSDAERVYVEAHSLNDI